MMTQTDPRARGTTIGRIGCLVLAAVSIVACSDRNTTNGNESALTDQTRQTVASTSNAHDGQATQVEKPLAGKETSTPPSPASPAETKAAWREGVSLYQRGNYKDASERLRIASAGRPDHAYTFFMLGLSLWKSGQNEEAEKALERAGSLNPSFLKAWIDLARVRMELHDPTRALEAADSALGVDGNSADALHQRGRALADLGRVSEAFDALRKAQAADPENGYIANTLGNQLIRAGRPAEALPLLESARERLPRVPYVRNNLGAAYERTDQIEKAVEEYRAAVEAGDSGGKAASSLARLNAGPPQGIAQGNGKAHGGSIVENPREDGESDGTLKPMKD